MTRQIRILERYACIGDRPTVKALRDLLNDLIKQGFGEDTAMVWSDDEQAYVPVGGVLYARNDRQVQILQSED